MKRLSTEKLLEQTLEHENIAAIRIKDEEIYFIGWLENAENYNVVIARKPIELRIDILMTSNIYAAVTASENWHTPMSTELIKTDAPIVELLKHTYSHESNKTYPDAEDHDVFVLTEEEMNDTIDALKNGDYILITA